MTIFYILLLISQLILALALTVYLTGLVFSSIMGAPYVPTKQKDIDKILEKAGLKKNQFFLELGSGDGRVVMEAVEKYRVNGRGIDINPILIWYSNFKAHYRKLSDVKFIRENIFNTDLSNVDVLYVFLMPQLIKKLLPKITGEVKKGTLLISHGFVIHELDRKLINKLDSKPFPTFYYRF